LSADIYTQLDGQRNRPYNTVEPLANHLKLSIDSSIRRNDSVGAADAVRNYKGRGNILICWEHSQLTDIALAIGVIQYAEDSGWNGAIEYPHKRFDLIWVIPAPYTQITSVESEKVPVLDDGKTPTPGGSLRNYPSRSRLLLILVTTYFIHFHGTDWLA
jgi:hypothetical protein